MAAYTQPQLCLPVITASSNGPHMKITLAASLVGATTVNVSLADNDTTRGKYWNDRDFGSASNLANALCIAANAAEVAAGTNGVWSASEVSGDYLGRINLARAYGDTADDVTNVLFTSSDFGGAMLGFTSNTATPDSTTYSGPGFDPINWVGTWIAGNLWIPQPSGLVLQGINETTTRDTGVSTSSPDGTTTRDFYGRVSLKRIEIVSVPAACVWQHYADDSDYTASPGATAGDLNMAFDKFRQQWVSIATGDYCRLFKDSGSVTTSADYVQLEPGGDDDWMWDTARAVAVESKAPLRYILTLTAFEV